MSTIEKLSGYFAAGQAGLVLTSVEPEECLRELADAARASRGTAERWNLLFWDAADALTDAYGNPVQLIDRTADADSDMAALLGTSSAPPRVGLHDTFNYVLTMARRRQMREEAEESIPDDDILEILCVRNFDRMLYPSGPQATPDPTLLMQAQKIINEGQGTRYFLILQTTPEFELPTELTVHCEYVHHDLPDSDERATIIAEMGVDESAVTPLVLNATAGLSRAKTAQYTAETVAAHGYLHPTAIFQKKASHLSRSSKLDVWSPEFVSQIKLWPVPGLENLHDATDVTLVNEETHITNKQLHEGEVRTRLRYIRAGKKVEQWLDPMPKEQFERDYRPERDFYSFRSVVGLSGLKQFLRNGFRPDVPDRAKMKHVLMLGVPGTGKSFTMQCCSGEFSTPLSSMQASNLYSKWLGDTDKILARMLGTVEMIGGILAIDEFQRFLPQGGSGGESGGVESRLLGTLLTWFNNQQSNLVLSAANNISNLPDEITRSGRVDALMFVGFPSRESKDAAWQMYMKRHELADQELPKDEYWVPADIMSCCRLAELQQVSIAHASRWISPSYEKNQKQMDDLMQWAESAGCICAETGERFKHPRNQPVASVAPKKVTRKIRTHTESGDVV